MSSINTSNSIGIQSVIAAGKRATDPNANPLQPGPNNPNGIRAANDSVNTEGKTPSDPDGLLRGPADGNAVRTNTTLTPQEATALNTAQKLIATTLIKPILAEARAARDAPAPWGQTQAEKQFGGLLDNRIADDISKAANFPIAQRIADQILKNSPNVDTQPHAKPGLPVTYTPVDIFG
ncbi:MAG: hypothetical protein JKY43_10605 [Phycisphaerales bacterium]|nr:hypothetical protein [Phycisphaerales bacterium]